MDSGQKKVVQYLDEAHATEQALVRVLRSQIAMTPSGSYRSSLELHLDQTRDHARRVARRLKALGQGSNPLLAVVRAAETVAGQVLALGKTPLDLLRGSGGPEKVLKNAKDTAATEALEIATYTTIERLARGVGDAETAELAASIRADEEQMLQCVLREIPKLTGAVVRADVDATEPVREAGQAATNGARKKTAAASRTTPSKRPAAATRPAAGRSAATRPAATRPAASKPAARPARAHDDLRAAAEAGDGAAAFTLWTRLRDTDFPAAEGWLRTAADLGEVRAAHALGLLLWRERNDPHAAVESLDRAAQADDPAAQRDLGIVLREHGDLHGAHYWLSRAAERDGEAREVLAAFA